MTIVPEGRVETHFLCFLASLPSPVDLWLWEGGAVVVACIFERDVVFKQFFQQVSHSLEACAGLGFVVGGFDHPKKGRLAWVVVFLTEGSYSVRLAHLV